MLVTRLLNLSSKFIFILGFFILFHSHVMGVESADIWKKETNKEKENIIKKNTENKPKINY